MWITNEGMVMDYHEFVPDKNQLRAPRNKFWRPKGTTYGDIVKMSLEDSNPTAFTGQARLSGDFNYFIGNDSSKWASSCHRYAEARAENPYPGMSLRYYFDEGSPRYDLVVKPGADPSQVSFKVEGAQGIRVREDGNLELKTPYGTILEKGLTAYQEVSGQRTQVPCRMIADGNRVHFDARQYDPSKPLIIDPLVFSTFLGTGDDWIGALSIDASGDLVVAGETGSSNFPTTTGAYQRKNRGSPNGGNAFVSKLSRDATKLLASTLIGGSNVDSAVGLASDPAGDLVIAGDTNSANFPVTSSAFQKVLHGEAGTSNVFISRISSDGTELLASSYIGGSGADALTCLCLDSSGDPLVAGSTYSSDYPVSEGAYQKVNNGTANQVSNGFVSKLNHDESQLMWSTYDGTPGTLTSEVITFGSLGEENVTYGYTGDQVNAVAVDSEGHAIVAGDYGDVVAFVTTFSPDGSTVVSSTTLAGSGCYVDNTLSEDSWVLYGDAALALTIDNEGNLIVGGAACSADFPTTAGAFQTTNGEFGAGASTGFVCKLSNDETKLLASTFLGGSDLTGDAVYSLSVDANNSLWVTGSSFSSNFPVTYDAFQNQNLNPTLPVSNVFVSGLASNETKLLYSTYLGGYDMSLGISVNKSGYPVVAGWSLGSFPATPGAFMTDPTINQLLGSACFISCLSPSTGAGSYNLEIPDGPKLWTRCGFR